MLTPTHLVSAQTLYLTSCIVVGHSASVAESLIAMLSALIPDLDSRQSYVGRLLPFISKPLEYHVGHRSFTHSLLFHCMLLAVAYLWLPFGTMLAISAGLFSHVLADMLTPAGVGWLWPSRIRCVLPGNARYRMDSMGKGELMFLIVVTIAGILLQPLTVQGRGTVGLLRDHIGNIDSAREDYDRQKGQYRFSLEVEGRDNQSFTDISGTYPVIGPYRENGFLLETEQGVISLCKNTNCYWYADHAALIKAEAEQTTAIEIHMDSLSVQKLSEVLLAYEDLGTVYLLGSFKARYIKPQPPTLSVSAEMVTLSYAKAEALSKLRNQKLRDIHLTVQIRHATDVVVNELEIPAEPAKSAGQSLLNKWL